MSMDSKNISTVCDGEDFAINRNVIAFFYFLKSETKHCNMTSSFHKVTFEWVQIHFWLDRKASIYFLLIKRLPGHVVP